MISLWIFFNSLRDSETRRMNPESSIDHNSPMPVGSDVQKVPRFVSQTDARGIDAELNEAIKQTLVNKNKTALLEEFFLESLAFSTMRDREEVTEAHVNTFQFMFDEDLGTGSSNTQFMSSNNNFVRWLRGDSRSDVYWISGKAGSGKSTLMRHLCKSPRTTQHLKTWAGDKSLICARFYFWTSGNVDQRSRAGLLRYLLHQLLSLRKDLLPEVFPHLWILFQETKNRVKAAVEWPASLLMAGIQKYLDLCVGHSKIFLLIDGLDELDGD
jgi:hypothetical protein